MHRTFFQIIHNISIALMSSDYLHPSFDSQQTKETLSLMAKGSYHLLDFQWRFAVITKHSLMNQTDCLIQLKLVLTPSAKTKEQCKKIVHLELSMTEFNEFFREMEKISNTLAIIN